MKDIEVINGMKIDMTEYKKFVEKTLEYKKWLISEKRKEKITEKNKREIELMKLKATRLLNKRVILTIEFEGYKDSSGDVEGIITFVGNTCLILDIDGDVRTKKDRKVYDFGDIIEMKADNIRELKSKITKEVN